MLWHSKQSTLAMELEQLKSEDLHLDSPVSEHFNLTFVSLRSWEKICVVLKESQIFFYKDQKTYRTHPGDTFKGEPSVDLINCTAEVATDYTKKKYVFRLRYVVFFSDFSSKINVDLIPTQTCKRWLLLVPSSWRGADGALGERDQQPGSAPGRGGQQEPDPAPRLREEGRTKEKIVLHSQEKVKLSYSRWHRILYFWTVMDTHLSSSSSLWLTWC